MQKEYEQKLEGKANLEKLIKEKTKTETVEGNCVKTQTAIIFQFLITSYTCIIMLQIIKLKIVRNVPKLTRFGVIKLLQNILIKNRYGININRTTFHHQTDMIYKDVGVLSFQSMN